MPMRGACGEEGIRFAPYLCSVRPWLLKPARTHRDAKPDRRTAIGTPMAATPYHRNCTARSQMVGSQTNQALHHAPGVFALQSLISSVVGGRVYPVTSQGSREANTETPPIQRTDNDRPPLGGPGGMLGLGPINRIPKQRIF